MLIRVVLARACLGLFWARGVWLFFRGFGFYNGDVGEAFVLRRVGVGAGLVTFFLSTLYTISYFSLTNYAGGGDRAVICFLGFGPRSTAVFRRITGGCRRRGNIGMGIIATTTGACRRALGSRVTGDGPPAVFRIGKPVNCST